MKKDELTQLEHFVEKAEELVDKKSFRKLVSSTKITGTLKWKEGEGVTVETNVPSYDELASFMILFRQFYYKSEPLYFLRIVGLLGKYRNEFPQKLMRTVDDWKDAYNRRLSGKIPDPFLVTYQDKLQTPEEILNTYFSGKFHSDRIEIIEKLRMVDRLVGDFYWVLFVASIVSLTTCIYQVALVIKPFISKKKLLQ